MASNYAVEVVQDDRELYSAIAAGGLTGKEIFTAEPRSVEEEWCDSNPLCLSDPLFLFLSCLSYFCILPVSTPHSTTRQSSMYTRSGVAPARPCFRRISGYRWRMKGSRLSSKVDVLTLFLCWRITALPAGLYFSSSATLVSSQL
mmetsp:Transcript_31605/g.82484  ORF Transcript_31605/g.82484 Transcript_31605/m.82484 type:complete len:145 (-) Transcript_31605:701-1135(-)